MSAEADPTAGERECRYPCDCGQFDDEHCSCMDGHATSDTGAGERELATCDQEHGSEGNPARVYGHHGSPRTCIRVKATNEWVYDPAWEMTS